MKKLNKILSVGLCLSILMMQGLTVFAEGKTVAKDENVFITLNPDGSVEKQIVSDWLHNDSGFADYADKSVLTNIVNLKSSTMPTIDGENLTWNTDENDIYYQGNTDKTPPITTKISYSLDGTEMSAEDLMGKSGHLEITLNLTNNEKTTATINGKSKTIYTPFAVAVACDFPTGTFANVHTEDSTIQSDATNQIVGFVAFPGLKENFDGVFDEELADLKAGLKSEFVISSDVTDFDMPSIMIAAATNLGDLKDLSSFSEFDSLMDGIDQLKSATDQLLAGTTDLKTGTAQLKAATNALKDKINTQLVPSLKATAPLQQELANKMADLEKELAGLKIPDMTSIQTQIGTAINGVSDASSAQTLAVLGVDYNSLTAEQQAKLTAAKTAIKTSAATEISKNMAALDMSALSSLKTTLVEIQTLSEKLMGGMAQLTSALYNPSDDINNPQTVANAIIAISLGADKLDSGATQLKDGMTEYYNEGIGKLAESDLSGDMNTAIAIMNEMQKSADSYNSYTGSNTEISSTKFIMKTNKIQKTVQAEADTKPVAKKESLWTKFINLFKNLFD